MVAWCRPAARPGTRTRTTTRTSDSKIRLGISACLLGQRVRYDGGHKRDDFLLKAFGRHVEWVPVCPEVECGLPVPREPMHLEGDPDAPRLVALRPGVDHTDRMLRWARRRVKDLATEGVSGFIFKSRSPSCGTRRSPVESGQGRVRRAGAGLFAREFTCRLPLVPAEEEGRLHDPGLCESFVERILCLKRYRDAVGARRSVRALLAFHADHELQFMAHGAGPARQLGRLIGRAEQVDRRELFADYERLMLRTLTLKATPAKIANALRRTVSALKGSLSVDEKAELAEAITSYKAGLVPLVAPLKLVSRSVRTHGEPHLKRQVYLNPHPLRQR